MKRERAVNPIKSIGRSRASLVQQNSWLCFQASALFLLMSLISGCETKTNQIDQNRRDEVTEEAPQKLKSTNDQTMGRDDLILVSYFPFPGANICPFMVDAHSPYCLKTSGIPEGFEDFRIIRNNYKSGSAVSTFAGEHCKFETCIVLNGVETWIDAAQNAKNYTSTGIWVMSPVFNKSQITGYIFYSIDVRTSSIVKNCYIFDPDIWIEIDNYCRKSGGIK
jgi:hypothetical protein